MDKMRKQVDKDDIKEVTETHFGPEEHQELVRLKINRKRDIQNVINSELQKQIRKNEEYQKRKLEKEKLTDSVNMGAVNQKLYNEKLEKITSKRQQ